MDLKDTLIYHSAGNLFWKDRDGRYMGCNKNFCDVLQIASPKEIIGKTDKDIPIHRQLLSGEQIISLMALDEEVMLKGETRVVEEKGLDAQGKLATYLTVKKPIIDDNGEIRGLIGTSINITDKKISEELIQEKAVAGKTIQTLKAIAGSLAHELRTPLTSINLLMESTGNTIRELIHYQEDVEAGRTPWPVSQESLIKLRSALPLIKHQLTSAEMIIELQLKGIQNQDTLIDKRFFSQQSMAEIVNQALEYYPFRQDQRALVHWLADKDFMFQGEPHLMRNVLYNLIKNALYFIQEADRGEIFISLESDDTFHYLYFKDTAMGMSPEVVEKVFDKFYSQSRHGTGLGLSFCKYVIEAFKGDITCQSKDGEYAQFILRFPHIK